ncbi:MAG TPA: hypothetical protein VGJ56_23015, partial [Reyranella sp.]
EVAQGRHCLRDDALVDAAQVQAAQHACSFTPGKQSRACARTLITPAWLQAVSPTTPLSRAWKGRSVRRSATRRVPAPIVEGTTMLAGHADLEAAAAGYLAGDVDGVISDGLRIPET